jgi:hypothetical protein
MWIVFNFPPTKGVDGRIIFFGINMRHFIQRNSAGISHAEFPGIQRLQVDFLYGIPWGKPGVRARRLGRNNQDRIARKGLQGEDSQEKKPGHDMEKDSLERAARARGISYEGHIRTTRTGQP